MSGYVGYSMSVRAASAYAMGKMPASKAAKELGIPAPVFRKHFRPCEWHHTSKRYNITDFYDIDDIREQIASNARLCLEIRRDLKGPRKRSEWWDLAVAAALGSMYERLACGQESTNRCTPRHRRLSALAEKFGIDYSDHSAAAKRLEGQQLTDANYMAVIESIRREARERADLDRRQQIVEAMMPECYRATMLKKGGVLVVTQSALKRFRGLAREIARRIPESELSPERVRQEIESQ